MNDPAKLSELEPLFERVVGAAIAIGGVILFIMIIIGGFNYISAGGDPQKAGTARNTITYAIFGIVFLALAYLFLQLIAGFTGINDILNFQVTQQP